MMIASAGKRENYVNYRNDGKQYVGRILSMCWSDLSEQFLLCYPCDMNLHV